MCRERERGGRGGGGGRYMSTAVRCVSRGADMRRTNPSSASHLAPKSIPAAYCVS